MCALVATIRGIEVNFPQRLPRGDYRAMSAFGQKQTSSDVRVARLDLIAALITFDRKSIELVLLVVGVLRDALILDWHFRPRPFG